MITPTEIVQQHLMQVVDVDVVSKVPADRPSLFVRVDTGAPQPETKVSYLTTVIVQVYGVDLEQVIDLIDTCRHALESIDARDDVYWWDETSGPYEFPDPDLSEVHRWQLVGQLTHHM